jgi:hypothetical protein
MGAIKCGGSVSGKGVEGVINEVVFLECEGFRGRREEEGSKEFSCRETASNLMFARN